MRSALLILLASLCAMAQNRGGGANGGMSGGRMSGGRMSGRMGGGAGMWRPGGMPARKGMPQRAAPVVLNTYLSVLLPDQMAQMAPMMGGYWPWPFPPPFFAPDPWLSYPQPPPNFTVVYPPSDPPPPLPPPPLPAPEPERQRPAPPRAAPEQPLPTEFPALIAIRQGGVYSVSAYWTTGTSLHFITTRGAHMQIPLSRLEQLFPAQKNGRSVPPAIPAR